MKRTHSGTSFHETETAIFDWLLFMNISKLTIRSKYASRLLSTAAAVIFCLCAFAGCAPRGETNTLDEILRASKERYLSASKNTPSSPEVSGKLKELDGLLNSLESPKDASTINVNSQAVAGALQPLILHAGLTSRPALTEISEQYRAFSAKDLRDFAAQRSAMRLLVSRTYSALASELEAVRFSL
jgi:hypothetical protein